METTFKGNKTGDFDCILRMKSCRKLKTKAFTVRKTITLWILSSVATLKAHKSESKVETNCFKYKTKTIAVSLAWFLTTRNLVFTHRNSKLTLSLPKKEELFFKWSPMFASLFLKEEKRYRQMVFTIVSYNDMKAYVRKKKQNWTKLRYWETVANEKCTADIGDLSSVRKLFWVNHATQKARHSPKKKIFGGTNVS